MKDAIAWVNASRIRQALLLVIVCAAVFLPRLGSTGLSMSEGHRAIPAWEMLADARVGEAHWLVPRMFETAYLRKPPGMLWAIAASSSVFGETEFAARLPSAVAATLLALAVWWFATSWFGPPWGLAAGLAQALLPVTWPSARSAEIESLHLLTTGLASLLVLHIGCCRRGRLPAWAVALSGATAAMVLTKGPSGAPFVLGAFVALALVLKCGPARVMIAAVGVLGGVGLGVVPLRVAWAALDEPTVRQGVDAFLWEPSRLVEIGLLAPAVLATMLPAALALLFPWGPDARRERETAQEHEPASRYTPDGMARALGVSCVAVLAVMTLAGVSNPRYGLPICALLTPLVAYVARGASGTFVRTRPGIARTMLLGRAWAWPTLLLLAAAAYVGGIEPDRRASSGREAGVALAAHLPDGSELWADEAIEARPEVLHYARRTAAAEGRAVRVRWLKPGFRPRSIPESLLMLVREDALVDELASLSTDPGFAPVREITRVEAHKFTFVLVRVGPG